MPDGRSINIQYKHAGSRMLLCGTQFSTARGSDRLLPTKRNHFNLEICSLWGSCIKGPIEIDSVE